MADWLTWSIQLFEAYPEDWAESTSRKEWETKQSEM